MAISPQDGNSNNCLVDHPNEQLHVQETCGVAGSHPPAPMLRPDPSAWTRTPTAAEYFRHPYTGEPYINYDGRPLAEMFPEGGRRPRTAEEELVCIEVRGGYVVYPYQGNLSPMLTGANVPAEQTAGAVVPL